MIKRGYIVEFKRGGFVSKFLGSILKLFERDWDGWGWHLGIAWGDDFNGWYVLEALSGGVEMNYYSDEYLRENTRVWKWFDKPPLKKKMGKFLLDHINENYDVGVYFWTLAQYLIRHYFNRRIPRLLDNRWTCWELAFWFCREMGKPIQSIYDCPLISDAIRVFKNE